MDLPEIPTDNLYKFITIFGLILMVCGIAIPMYQERLYAEQTTEFVSKIFVSVDGTINALAESEKDSDQQQRAREAMELLRLAITSTLNLSTYERQVTLFWRIGLGAAILGMLFTSAGFYFWYNLHQKFHDMILKRQATVGISAHS